MLIGIRSFGGKSMEKILFIRSSSKPARVFKEAISLEKAGYYVEILLWDRSSNKSKVEKNGNLTVYYFGLKAYYGKLKLAPYLMVWWAYELQFLLKNDADIIHACCFDTVVPAILTKLLKRKKLIYDIFDFYAEALPEHIPTYIINFVATLERLCIQFADAVIIVDESRKVQIDGAKVDTFEIVMNCPSIQNFTTHQKNTVFSIFYGGMLSKTRGLNQLINAIKNDNDINLIIAGLGEDENIFTPIFNHMDNVKFLGWINYDDYISETQQADLIFGFYDPVIPNNRLASPNKLFEAMMCETPIIVNEETSMAEIVKNENCGIIIPYDDEYALKESILKLRTNPDMCKQLGKNGRKAFEREYNWEIMESRLINLYKNIL